MIKTFAAFATVLLLLGACSSSPEDDIISDTAAAGGEPVRMDAATEALLLVGVERHRDLEDTRLPVRV